MQTVSQLSSASTGLEVRLAARQGRLAGHTSGLAADYVQGNLVILPADLASDFQRYCERNPKPCPVLAVSKPGDPALPQLAADLDIRSDVPAYRVWHHGALVDEVSSLQALWRDDLVSFVLGCSFSFEHALLAQGIALRHVAQGRNVAMYRTDIPTQPAGPFQGPMVVSMRPLKAADAVRAIEITSRMPAVHGAPVHLGDPGLIGIQDLDRPDFGDAVEVRDDELPVFWACGVTPQVALAAALPALCITHVPGCMLVTDRLNRDLVAT
ncbi:putative hydro-lyase [Ramlibacter sp. MAHUQ-53]|uniref:putative hydro-lyase n=1 Tax=unclassified Ramlibacter TaxID=2617605 RepID=UPI0036455915